MLRATSVKRAGIFLLGAVSLAGCLLTTSLDGLSGGTAGGAVEAGSSFDGGAEGAPLVGDGGRFCEGARTRLFLCADFDDGAFPPQLSVEAKGGSSVVPATGDVRSPPFAALFTVPANSGATSTSLRRTLPSTATSLVIELDVHVEEYGSKSDFDLVTIAAGEPEVGFQINGDGTLAWDEDFAQPNPDGKTNVESLVGATLPSGWAHLKWAIQVEGTTAKTELFLDGTSVGRHDFLAEALTSSSPVLEIGDSSQSSLSKEWRLRTDNVTVDLR